MLKILLVLLIAVEAGILLLLIAGIVLQITSPGGINILLPELGLVVSLNAILLLLFVAELMLAVLTLRLMRYIKSKSSKMP